MASWYRKAGNLWACLSSSRLDWNKFYIIMHSCISSTGSSTTSRKEAKKEKEAERCSIHIEEVSSISLFAEAFVFISNEVQARGLSHFMDFVPVITWSSRRGFSVTMWCCCMFVLKVQVCCISVFTLQSKLQVTQTKTRFSLSKYPFFLIH